MDDVGLSVSAETFFFGWRVLFLLRSWIWFLMSLKGHFVVVLKGELVAEILNNNVVNIPKHFNALEAEQNKQEHDNDDSLDVYKSF